MKIIPEKSVFQSLDKTNENVTVTNKHFSPFSKGTNKAKEYSWFYQVCIEGNQGEQVNIAANIDSDTSFSHTNSLAYFSLDRWQWQEIDTPIETDHTRLAQKYTFELPQTGRFYLSNTMLFNYKLLVDLIINHCKSNNCTYQSIGSSLGGNDLPMITYQQSKKSLGNIFLATGCHPAEPDFLASKAILEYLESPASKDLRNNYTIHVMPLQNPDGYQNKSCLTNNGINLYWNFRKDDLNNCPEAFYLWNFIKKNPPLLYLDIHAYVHQLHRPPMPYLKTISSYQGKPAKKIAQKIDRALVKDSKGYFKTGLLATWPEALSHYVTKEFNTIAYTKYHLNFNEGIEASQQRALQFFKSTTNVLLQTNTTSNHILIKPYGNNQPDNSDKPLSRSYYDFISRLKQTKALIKAYSRLYYIRYWKSG